MGAKLTLIVENWKILSIMLLLMFYCDFFWLQPARLNRWWSQISCLSLTNFSSAGVLASMWDRSAAHVFSLFSLLYHQLMLQRRRDVTGSRPDWAGFSCTYRLCQPGRKLVQISESPKNLFFLFFFPVFNPKMIIRYQCAHFTEDQWFNSSPSCRAAAGRNLIGQTPHSQELLANQSSLCCSSVW